jgi:replicative superfamily II helicase
MDTDEIVFHRVQAEVYARLMEGENVVLSAPTSFGKSLIIDAVVASWTCPHF